MVSDKRNTSLSHTHTRARTHTHARNGRPATVGPAVDERRPLHVEVVMSWEVGVEDKLLHQVTGGVKEDVLWDRDRSLGSRPCVSEEVHGAR